MKENCLEWFSYLFSTHCTCQLWTLNIWTARYRATPSFHVIQQGAIYVNFCSWYGFCINVNTNVFGWMWMIVMLRHQIPVIFPSPTRGTLVSRKDHQLGIWCLYVTHNHGTSSYSRFVLVKRLRWPYWFSVPYMYAPPWTPPLYLPYLGDSGRHMFIFTFTKDSCRALS